MKIDQKAILNSLIAAFCFLVALGFGITYGNAGNQATYLPHALSQAKDLLTEDWLISNTEDYHGFFSLFLKYIVQFEHYGIYLIIANLAIVSSTLYLIYRLYLQLSEKLKFDLKSTEHFNALLLIGLVIVLQKTMSVGHSYIFEGALQPSTIAAFFWIASILTFLQNKYLFSGLLLALAGLFHTNFLLLGIGWFGLSLIIEKQYSAKYYLKVLLPSFFIVAVKLNELVGAGLGENADQARYLFQNIRSPHHYIARSFMYDFILLTGWIVSGLAATRLIIKDHEKYWALLLAGTLCLAGAFLLNAIYFVPIISQLFVWRMAPFVVLLSQIPIFILISTILFKGFSVYSTINRFYLLTFCAGIYLVLFWRINKVFEINFPAIIVISVSVVTYVLVNVYSSFIADYYPTVTRRFSKIVAMDGMLLFIFISINEVEKSVENSLLYNSSNNLFYEFVKNTEIDAVYLIPPDMALFRLLGQRAVIVDWKSTPIMSSELLEWYSRIEEVSVKGVKSEKEAQQGYLAKGSFELSRIAELYNASYIVIQNNEHKGKIATLPLVYKGERFSIYEKLPIQ